MLVLIAMQVSKSNSPLRVSVPMCGGAGLISASILAVTVASMRASSVAALLRWPVSLLAAAPSLLSFAGDVLKVRLVASNAGLSFTISSARWCW
ncbi:MAG TPA: hypothetical protein VNT60_09040 [Deinococcales bacterium]|nr:hypothetical protein [Deinococcales bacterium]